MRTVSLFLLYSIFVGLFAGEEDLPRPTQIPYSQTVFGTVLYDPFHYFSNDSYFDEVKRYIDEENDWADKYAYDEELVQILKEELEVIYYGDSEYYHDDDMDFVNDGEYYYYYDDYITTYPEADYEYYYTLSDGSSRWGLWMRRNLTTKEDEQVVLDEEELYELLGEPDFFYIAKLEPSPNHHFLSFMVDTVGDEIYTIGFRDLRNMTYLTDKLERSYYGMVWGSDSERIMYEQIKHLPNQPLSLSSYQIGTLTSPIEVFNAHDDTFSVSLELSSDREMILMTDYSYHGIQCYFLPRREYNQTDVSKRINKFPIDYEEDVEYYIDHATPGFLVRRQTSPDSNFGVHLYSDDFSSVETIIEESEEYIITQIDCFSEVVFVWGFDTTHVYPFLEMYPYTDLYDPAYIDLDSLVEYGEHYAIEPYYDEEWYPLLGGSNGYFDSELYFYYSSLMTPYEIYSVEYVAGKKKKMYDLWWIYEGVVEGFDPDDYLDGVIFVQSSSDPNVQIPVNIVYKKEWQDGETSESFSISDLKERPVWVYTYGAYGTIDVPAFQDNLITLFNRGFVYAMVNVRGSSIRGMGYYHDGYRLEKKHSWEDLVDVLEYFKTECLSSKIIIEGVSAGGLTNSRTMIQRKDLVDILIATVPFVDVVNSMLDPEVPLTMIERSEWGDPENNQTDFEYMLSYDPYYTLFKNPYDDCVNEYPHIYLQAGLNDQRVEFSEPLKFIAKLRTCSLQNNNDDDDESTSTQVMKTSLGGHFGSGVDEIEEIARLQAFVIERVFGGKDKKGDKDKREKELVALIVSLSVVGGVGLVYVYAFLPCWILMFCCVGCCGFGLCLKKGVKYTKDDMERYGGLEEEGKAEEEEEEEEEELVQIHGEMDSK